MGEDQYLADSLYAAIERLAVRIGVQTEEIEIGYSRVRGESLWHVSVMWRRFDSNPLAFVYVTVEGRGPSIRAAIEDMISLHDVQQAAGPLWGELDRDLEEWRDG